MTGNIERQRESQLMIQSVFCQRFSQYSAKDSVSILPEIQSVFCQRFSQYSAKDSVVSILPKIQSVFCQRFSQYSTRFSQYSAKDSVSILPKIHKTNACEFFTFNFQTLESNPRRICYSWWILNTVWWSLTYTWK